MPRADAQRNLDALVEAAKAEFAEHGVDVAVRAIAVRAGVGTATLYRHFPQRSDLIAAVFRQEIDACVDAAPALMAENPPDLALELWLQRYTEFVATKHGLAANLHSGEPAYASLRIYFSDHLGPVLQELLDAAEEAGSIRVDMEAIDLLGTVANLCIPPPGTAEPARAHRMVGLLLDGMRYQAAD